MINQPLHDLCAQCHEPDAESFQTLHLGIAAADMDCIKCHSPHVSMDPKFFRDVMHAPFAARSCEPCHIVEQ
jgi:predicted CXXCH cytochrome family protein